MTLKRAKGKPRRPGNRAMTVTEAAHVDRVKRGGCGCCIARGYLPDLEGEPPAVEAHHHLEAGLRIGHGTVEGLCCWHHRGVMFVNGWTKAEHRLRLGPSLAAEPAEFERLFGTDAERLADQAARIGAAP